MLKLEAEVGVLLAKAGARHFGNEPPIEHTEGSPAALRNETLQLLPLLSAGAPMPYWHCLGTQYSVLSTPFLTNFHCTEFFPSPGEPSIVSSVLLTLPHTYPNVLQRPFLILKEANFSSVHLPPSVGQGCLQGSPRLCIFCGKLGGTQASWAALK